MSDFIIGLITQWSYLGIFFLMVAENIFPPILVHIPFSQYWACVRVHPEHERLAFEIIFGIASMRVRKNRLGFGQQRS